MLSCLVFAKLHPRPPYSFASPPPVLRTRFQVPYPVSPLFVTLTKTSGVGGYSSHFGTCPTSDIQTSERPSVLPSYPLSFQVFAHSLAGHKTQLFSPPSLPQITRSVEYALAAELSLSIFSAPQLKLPLRTAWHHSPTVLFYRGQP